MRFQREIAWPPDERVLHAGEFSRSNLAFWAKVQMAVSNRRIAGSYPNLTFGVIPTGTQRMTYPLPSVAGVTVDNRIWALGIIFGVLFALLGLGALTSPSLRLGGIILLVGGVLIAVNGFSAQITITNSGGQAMATRVAYYERDKAAAFARQVNEVLTSLSPQPPMAAATPPSAQSAGAMASLAELKKMADAGLVTPEEFEAKRNEILKRV